jgi:hypothetical protein
VDIRTGTLVREILVFGTRYVLDVTRLWNEHFNQIDGAGLAKLAREAARFDFQAPDN